MILFRRGIRHLVGGMCETDYSGYPDCRDATLRALQSTINPGMKSEFIIETPLMRIDRAATWKMAENLGGKPFVRLLTDETHSCYTGDRSHKHDWGFGCGACPACDLRAAGWARYVES